MKQCKDCKWIDKTFSFLWLCKLRVSNKGNNCESYSRKRWKLWAPKLILIFALLLCGCSQTKLTLPDGSSLVRTRFLDWEKIGSVSYDDGSFTLDGYESDLTRALGIIDRLIARKEVKP